MTIPTICDAFAAFDQAEGDILDAITRSQPSGDVSSPPRRACRRTGESPGTAGRRNHDDRSDRAYCAAAVRRLHEPKTR